MMQCKEGSVYYPTHSEKVRAGRVHGKAIGICCRCGEIVDMPLVKRLARKGDEECREALREAGIAYLSTEEAAADAALDRLTPEQRAMSLRRNSR